MAELTPDSADLQEPLSAEQRQLLSDRSLSEANPGLHLAGRLVTDLAVSGLYWDGSWAGARVERVNFRDCHFFGHVLGAATYRDVTFENCVFDRCDFGEGTLERCRFLECKLIAGSTRGLSLQDCGFSNGEAEPEGSGWQEVPDFSWRRFGAEKRTDRELDGGVAPGGMPSG